MTDPHVLVDARAVTHPTAGGRGIGNYTLGLLEGLQCLGVDFTALIERDDDRRHLDAVVDGSSIALLRRQTVRRLLTERSWYVATGLFLHPISFDPVPRMITEVGIPVAGVMYDVIPYREPGRYLTNDNAARQARLRAVLARTVDATLAISRFSAETAIDVLDLDPRTVRVIGAGVARAFSQREDVARSSEVVAVTGADPRKNTVGLIRGWAEVSRATRAEHRLVIVASAPPGQLAAWRELAAELGCGDDVDVRGAIEQREMIDLLRRAWLVVQPSLDEGFGLPIVEAAACGAPVICSDRSALPEVLDEPSATFAAEDPARIAIAIEQGCNDVAHRRLLITAAARAAERWTWPHVAGKLVAAVEELEPARRARRSLPQRVGVVVTSPMDRAPDAVRALGARAEVVVLIDGSPTTTGVRPTHDAASVPAAGLGRYVKVHELDHVITVHDGPPWHQGRPLVERIAQREQTVVWSRDGLVGDSVLDAARGVIVASSSARDAVVERRPDLPVLVLPEPATDRSEDEAAARLWEWLGSVNAAGSQFTGPAQAPARDP